MDVLSYSDPMVVVSERTPNGYWKEKGRTEVIKCVHQDIHLTSKGHIEPKVRQEVSSGLPFQRCVTSFTVLILLRGTRAEI